MQPCSEMYSCLFYSAAVAVHGSKQMKERWIQSESAKLINVSTRWHDPSRSVEQNVRVELKKKKY
jgi:hypothetical protein